MSDEYLVEKIIGKRIKNGKIQYKIKWEGYPLSQSTWEPVSNLQNILEMIDDYNRNQNKNEKNPPKESKKEKEVNTSSLLNKKRKLPILEKNIHTGEKNNHEESKSFEHSKKIEEKNDITNQEQSNSNIENNNNNIVSTEEKEKEGIIALEQETENKPQKPKNQNSIHYLQVMTINKEFNAVVQVSENGQVYTKNIPTKELKVLNPDILIDFYESKIKFTMKS